MVSRVVHDQVQDKLGFEFDDMGEQSVKNIARPIGVHRVHLAEQLPRPGTPAIGKIERAAPERPSIAVLPFVNMSGDPEQEYFADGISEDIIILLCSNRPSSCDRRKAKGKTSSEHTQLAPNSGDPAQPRPFCPWRQRG